MNEKERLFETIQSGITDVKEFKKLGFKQCNIDRYRIMFLRKRNKPKKEYIQKGINIMEYILYKNHIKKYPKLYS